MCGLFFYYFSFCKWNSEKLDGARWRENHLVVLRLEHDSILNIAMFFGLKTMIMMIIQRKTVRPLCSIIRLYFPTVLVSPSVCFPLKKKSTTWSMQGIFFCFSTVILLLYVSWIIENCGKTRKNKERTRTHFPWNLTLVRYGEQLWRNKKIRMLRPISQFSR